jgi:hypothetical protein
MVEEKMSEIARNLAALVGLVSRLRGSCGVQLELGLPQTL